MEPDQVVIAQTERLTLRVFDPADAKALFAIVGSPQTMRLMPGGLLADEAAANELIGERIADQQNLGHSIWAVVLRSTGELIGNCGFRRERDGSLEVGYLIDHHYWRQGYGTEAARAAVTYAFDQLHVSSVVATIRPGNNPSIAVAKRLGMHEVQTTADASGELLVFRLDKLAAAGK